jgi:hypothetical protein
MARAVTAWRSAGITAPRTVRNWRFSDSKISERRLPAFQDAHFRRVAVPSLLAETQQFSSPQTWSLPRVQALQLH